MSSSRPHRCDEFPAEYSLASCSPAELASAFSAASCCNQQPPFVELSSANGNRGASALSHSGGSLHYHAVSGSSHENAVGARRALGGFFLRDRSWPLPLDAFDSSHRKTKPKPLVGQSMGRIPYVSIVVDNSSGSFDSAPVMLVGDESFRRFAQDDTVNGVGKNNR